MEIEGFRIAGMVAFIESAKDPVLHLRLDAQVELPLEFPIRALEKICHFDMYNHLIASSSLSLLNWK